MYVISDKATSCNNIILRISKSVQSVFDEYRQIKENDLEACGILIGNHKIDGNTICINYVTKPQGKDVRGRYSYKMDAATHQNILEKYFKLSNNEEVYLGTWHSHPESYPMPSRDDIIDWEKQHKSNENIFPRMVFAIIGIKKVKFWITKKCGFFELAERSLKYERNI
jgi:integrative and conjugative element protein (TIGR02256 family)